MTVEQRLDQLEKRNKRLTVALTMTVVAMAAVVTMAATGKKSGDFATVTARFIWVVSEDGRTLVQLGPDRIHGGGSVRTYQPNGMNAVELGVSDNGGEVKVRNRKAKIIAEMTADHQGNGVVGAYNQKGEGRSLQPGP